MTATDLDEERIALRRPDCREVADGPDGEADEPKAQAETDKELAKQQAAAQKAEAAAEKERQKEYDRLMKASGGTSRTRTTRKADASPLEQVLNSKSTQTILNSVIRGIFGTGRR